MPSFRDGLEYAKCAVNKHRQCLIPLQHIRSDVKPNTLWDDDGLLLRVIVLRNSGTDEEVLEVENDRFTPVPWNCAFNIE
jgi:hypothetical protein